MQPLIGGSMTYQEALTILGVTKEADDEVIKASYRALSKKYHPDHNPEGEEHYKAVQEAYEFLNDPEVKKAQEEDFSEYVWTTDFNSDGTANIPDDAPDKVKEFLREWNALPESERFKNKDSFFSSQKIGDLQSSYSGVSSKLGHVATVAGRVAKTIVLGPILLTSYLFITITSFLKWMFFSFISGTILLGLSFLLVTWLSSLLHHETFQQAAAWFMGNPQLEKAHIVQHITPPIGWIIFFFFVCFSVVVFAVWMTYSDVKEKLSTRQA